MAIPLKTNMTVAVAIVIISGQRQPRWVYGALESISDVTDPDVITSLFE